MGLSGDPNPGLPGSVPLSLSCCFEVSSLMTNVMAASEGEIGGLEQPLYYAELSKNSYVELLTL